MEFISVPVILGFTYAAVIIITCSQMNGLFGLTLKGTDYEESELPGLAGTLVNLYHSFPTIRYQDTLMGVCCCVALIILMVSESYSVMVSNIMFVSSGLRLLKMLHGLTRFQKMNLGKMVRQWNLGLGVRCFLDAFPNLQEGS